MGQSPEDKEEVLRDPVVRFHSYLSGGTSSLLSALPTIIVFPVYKTVFRQQLHNTRLHQAVGQLYKEGLPRLYRGVAPPLLMRTLNGTLLFGLQDTLVHQLSLSSPSVIPASALPAVAGLGAGVVEAVIFTPFERVQNVLQNGQNDRHLPTLKSVLVRLKEERLASGYFRAFLPITARNAFGSCLYFGLKGPMCAAVEGQGLSPTASSFVSGTLTSMAISLALYPLSVLVANMQAGVGGEVKGAMACWRKLWDSRQRSIALLYRGGSLVILRSCITWGITTALYDKQERKSDFHYALPHQLSSKMGDNNPITNEVKTFDKKKLRRTSTKEDNSLPTKEDIEEEKRAVAAEKKGDNTADSTTRRMVVPDSTNVVPHPDNGGSSGFTESQAEEGGQDLAVVELEEVRKLQELVRRLEVQNETLRNRGSRDIIHPEATGNSNLTASVNINKRLTCEGVSNSHRRLEHSSKLGCGDFEFSLPQDSSSGEEMSPLPVANRLEEEDEEEEAEEDQEPCGGFLTLTCRNGAGQTQERTQTPESPSQESYESETLAESDSGLDQTALDELDILDLEDECAAVEEEDSWLYVSPKKQAADPGPESPLKWCRKVFDHRSPETEMACRTLISRLDQTSRWRNMYSSPSAEAGSACSAGSGLISPGYHKSTNKSLLTCGSSGLGTMHSALSSQSSIDSELSTSDDSISMGYKLQDLTDVQVMARLQEESLRQDYASSSASASRRSSTASLHSLRRGGTYSDQEFDRYSLEDEEDDFCSLPQHPHRFTPSPLSSPRCMSPSTSNHGQEYSSRLGAPRTRTPRRSLQGPSPELLKFAKSEEELRHSMPNLAPRTSLRSLEAVRNSRSMEANLQSSGNRMSHLTHSPSTGMTCSRLRGNGQSPLSIRAPVKAVTPVGSMSAAHQSSRGLPIIHTPPTGGPRRIQSPGSANGGAYLPGRASTGEGRPVVGRGQPAPTASTRSRLSQPPRRSLGMTKISDESWKDGCY
ncbi:hypothetical protein LDENG_00023780 [Lucifuga dentata]|nr:hypothetical protein LDENG_00023780 [Lucifuga dentata]